MEDIRALELNGAEKREDDQKRLPAHQKKVYELEKNHHAGKARPRAETRLRPCAKTGVSFPHIRGDSMKLRASSMHKCRKCLVALLRGENDSGASSQAMMGSIIHDGFIPYYEKHKGISVVYREKTLENDLFTGHIDGYIKSTKQLFELKTVSTWIFRKITEPRVEHVQQALIYSDLGGFPSARFVYLDRDTGEYKEFDVDLTTPEMKATLKALKEKAKEVYAHVEKGLGVDDVEFDPFEVCDSYCQYETRPAELAPTVDDEIEDIDNLEEKDKLKELVATYEEQKLIEAEAKKEKERAGSEIKTIMESKKLREIIGCAIYYQNERKDFDKKGLERDHPEIYAKYESSKPSVYFRVKA